MAIPTNAFVSSNAKGIREDLEDVISNVSPYEVPFQANVGKVKVKSTRHEWQTDALAAADTTNANLEGGDITAAAASPTARVGNISQIMVKSVTVSATLDAVDKAGRKKELAYQLVKRGREIKRDSEAIYLNNQASVVGTTTVAPKLGGLPSWLTTNVSRATDGASGGYSTSTGLTIAATDSTGTGRTFTEVLLKAVMQSAFSAGGTPTMLMLGPYNKGQFSNATNFPGIATLRTNVAQNSNMATIIGAADVYSGDFGVLQVVPNRFQRERDAWLLDPEYVKIGTLRPLQQESLAKTGDAEKRMIVAESTLVVNNEASCGVISDLKTA